MYTKNIIRVTITLVMSVWMVACATTGMTQREQTEAYNKFIVDEKLESLKQITAFRFHSWSSLGDEHLLLYTSFNRPYLISFKNRCYDIQRAMNIGVDHTGSMLQANFDSILVPDSFGRKCFIKSIYKLTKEQRKAINKLDDKDEQIKKAE